MIIYGISANHHDAALAVARDETLLFASHSERYSRIKNDPHLNYDVIAEARTYGDPELLVWYEKPLQKRLRKLWSGQYREVLRADGASYLSRYGLRAPTVYVSHHECHAAGGFYTSPFDEAAILVVDAIGEWDTISMWRGMGERLTRIWRQRYPHSLGLLYSAFTARLGLKPNEEEYILMGMAAFGKPVYRDEIWKEFIAEFNPPRLVLTQNVHRGVRWWRPELTDKENIASSIQVVTEEILIGLAQWLARYTRLRKFVFSGGVALNCVANSRIALSGYFEDLWINPDPGDAGSCIGGIAALLRRHLVQPSPYIGYNIDRPLDVNAAVAALVRGDVIGIANGRAEFGPRALGNRSLLTDPRNPRARDRVNMIKQREPFRPFAPVIMAEHASGYFEMPVHSSPYMQFVARIRHPDRFPAVSHQDGTARVQTLSRKDNPTFYGLLEKFYCETGCPMLLNTSLNIKGEPLVNTWADAMRFGALHNVQVF